MDIGVLVRRGPHGERRILNRNYHWKRVTDEFELDEHFANEEYTLYEQNPEAAESAWTELLGDAAEIDTSASVSAAADAVAETSFVEGTGATAVGGTETTALLGGAAAAAGGEAVVLPTVATLAIPAVIAAASVSGAQAHKTPVVSLPGHHYLGPGNTVEQPSDPHPLDEDDRIAKQHDIDYNRAKSQQDVFRADEIAVQQFGRDFINTGNIHSLAGAVGLGAKRLAEGIVGVKYPANLPVSSPTGNMGDRGKFPIHSDPRNSPFWRSPQSFKSARQYISYVRYTWAQWNVARTNRNLPRVWPPQDVLDQLGTTMRPPRGGDNTAITFEEFRHSDEYEPIDMDGLTPDEVIVDLDQSDDGIEQFASNREIHSRNNRPMSLSPGMNAVLDEAILETDWDQISLADFDDLDGAGPSGIQDTTQATTTTTSSTTEMPITRSQHGVGNKRIRVDDGPPSEPSSAESSGSDMSFGQESVRSVAESRGADGGFDATTGPSDDLFRGGYRVRNGQMIFEKIHKLTFDTVPFYNVASNFANGSNLILTPLHRLDWDHMYMYMSQEEFNLIPAGSYVDSCAMDLMSLVYPSGYPVGATTATISQTNNAKLLWGAIDLEKKCRGGTDVLVTDMNSDMIPQAIDTDLSGYADSFILNQYGTDQTAEDNAVTLAGCAYDIPFKSRKVWAIYQPNKLQATARGFTAATAPGQEIFRNMCKIVNANNFVWDKDILKALVGTNRLFYKFKAAPIGDQFAPLEIRTDDFDQSIGGSNYYNLERNLTQLVPNANTSIAKSLQNTTRNSYPKVTYKSSRIEKGAHVVRGDSAYTPARQPTFHIGLQAIEKFDPTSNDVRASQFVQARMTVLVKMTMNINLPSYPNRFLRSKFYNTSIENMIAGNGSYNQDTSPVVTWGLPNDTAVAPVLDEVDRGARPTRSLPSAVKPVRQKPRTRSSLAATAETEED